MSKGRRAKKRQARLLRRRGIETGAAFWWGRRLVLVCGTDGPRRV
jgi:hypothetical protein